METRAERKQVLLAAVEQFLDHLEGDFDAEDELGAVVVCGELHRIEDDATIPTYWSSNENGIWRRGFFEVLADYHRLGSVE